ncbi:methylamine utilization protein MauJ [Priestia megaterium]|uniref:methylamine utilization protein MauJ n=1 Tax=Priestia megaterium TaxID=1404 RepID=UPI0035A92F10
MGSGMSFKYSVFVSGYIGLNFGDDFFIDPNHECVEAVQLIGLPKDERDEISQIDVSFYLKHLKENQSMSDVRPQVEDLLMLILDYLSFEHGLQIQEVKTEGISLSARFGMIHHFTEEDKSKMEQEISQVKFEPYKRLYRAAMRNKDDVARFMFLYSLLYQVLDVSAQWKIDEYIRSESCKRWYREEEDMQSTRYPTNSDKKETIYTWLRNQVGHTQSNSQIKSVAGIIQVKVNELSCILKQAINEHS